MVFVYLGPVKPGVVRFPGPFLSQSRRKGYDMKNGNFLHKLLRNANIPAGSGERKHDDYDRQGIVVLACSAAGIAVNLLLSYLANGLPVYLDTAGTIAVAALFGSFPGIITGMLTSVFKSFHSEHYLYYSIVNILVAIYTAHSVRKGKHSTPSRIFKDILTLAVISGVLGTVFEWGLSDRPAKEVEELARMISGTDHNYVFYLCTMFINIGLNLVDKAVTFGLALFAIRFVPADRRKEMWDSSWRQKPLTGEEIKKINRQARQGKQSLKKRMLTMLLISALAIAAVMSWITVMLSYESTKEEYRRTAVNTARFAASVLDPGMIDTYLKDKKNAQGYIETEDLLYRIRDNAPGVLYLYVLRIEKEGCRFIFDLAADDGTEPFSPGDFTPFEEAFEPYVPALSAGEEIEPVESDDTFGWVLSAYCPVRDEKGITVCYACADVSLEYMSNFVKQFLLRVLLSFTGFFVLILAYGFWTSGYFLIYPVGAMVASVEGFMQDDEDLETFDEHVRILKTLNIHTDDEIESLYHAICKLSSDSAEKMRGIRHYAEATAQMQRGLIITMADMVESRDSDTGAHVQKTAAYVRIILEGLKKKGYYAEKLTPKYMSDVENSAPLHDVGKINIPDAILNKPGKLTDEEYEIMKTHATAGKEIIEKAISTVQGASYLKEARNMAGYHHERWDGKGYPEGLSGEVIPLSARVMAVADVFDALSSPRVYKPAFPLEKALAILEEGSGTQFDPKCVEVFMESLPEVKLILKKFNG